MQRVVAVLVVIAIAVLAIRALVRDDVRPERAGTSDAVSENVVASPSEPELAEPRDATLRADVSPTLDENVEIETVGGEGAAPVSVEPRAPTGELEGRVLCDGGILSKDLRVSVEHLTTTVGAIARGLSLEALRDDGTFHFYKLELGTYRVSAVGSTASRSSRSHRSSKLMCTGAWSHESPTSTCAAHSSPANSSTSSRRSPSR